MKVLVATLLTQGVRRSDLALATEHELLVLPLVECGDHESVDGRCPCHRCFEGVTSDKVTTTALVIEHADLTVTDFKAAVRAMLSRLCWAHLVSTEVLNVYVDRSTHVALTLASQFPVGTVLEHRGHRVVARRVQPLTASSRARRDSRLPTLSS